MLSYLMVDLVRMYLLPQKNKCTNNLAYDEVLSKKEWGDGKNQRGVTIVTRITLSHLVHAIYTLYSRYSVRH